MRIVIAMFGFTALGVPFLLGTPAGQEPTRKEPAPLEVLEDRTLLSGTWNGYAHDPQHTGISDRPRRAA
jgi:hypothetical protein